MQMDTEVSEDERARNAVRNLFARQAVISADAYRRLLKPSIETEFASLSKKHRPMTKRSGSLPKTCANCFLPHPWDKNG